MKKSKWTKVASERSEHSHLRLYKQVCHHLDSSYTLNLFKVPTHRPLTKKLPHCKRGLARHCLPLVLCCDVLPSEEAIRSHTPA